jgi:UDP-glucose 4,6-dehydratase
LVQDRAFNDRRYYIGNSKLHALGWQEQVSWEEGLQRTINW